jgi:hypothetical protein
MNDPYFDTENCIKRLLREYGEHKKLIVAVDFDDTVFDFHGKGFRYPEVIDLLRRCQKLGFYIVLFTGANSNEWEKQRKHLAEQRIKVDSVNRNPIDLPFGNFGKIYYNILLDDRAGLFQAWKTLDIVVSEIESMK